MKFLHSIYLLTFMLLGCSENDTDSWSKPQHEGEIAFEISFASEQIEFGKKAIQPKVATDNQFNSTWEIGDAIGIYAVKRSKNDLYAGLLAENNYIHNNKLSLQEDGNWVGDTMFYAAGEEVLDFYAYYPYDINATNPTNLSFLVNTDQSDLAYNKSDLLLANKVTNIAKKDPVHLEFKHLLSLVQVEVPIGNMIGSGPNETLEVYFPNVFVGVNFNLTNENIDLIDQIKRVKLHRVATTTGTNYTFRALIPPQQISQGAAIDFIQDAKAYAYTHTSNTSLEQAHVKRYETNLSFTIHSILVNPGSFLMGSPKNQDFAQVDENLHMVTHSKEYRMSKYLITNAQYALFLNEEKVGANGLYKTQRMISAPSNAKPWGLKWENNKWMPNSGYENHPVIYVSWNGANEFAKWKGGSLATEAQWEYACRANTSTIYSFGNTPDILRHYGWYNASSGSITHQVGDLLPNQWGFYDMHGNVLEWVNDWYASYQSSALDPTGPVTGSKRVLRGGSWEQNYIQVRSACREKKIINTMLPTIGFRIVFNQ